jgi:hypothetical protein
VISTSNAVDTVTAVSPTIIGFAPPRISIIPVITETVVVAQTLTSSNGTWPNTSSGYEYQWQRSSYGGINWININSAVGTKYTVECGDVGHVIRSQVSVRNNIGTSTTYSWPTSVVAP